MSRWSDYGYPDLAGVPVQTALEGLYLAISERAFAASGSLPAHYLPDPGFGCCPITRAIWTIENMFLDFEHGIDYYYFLPNFERFKLSAAAEYLGEELITVPHTTSFSDPYPPISRDWMLQRYRMLNAAYLAEAYGPQVRSVYGSGWGYSDDGTLSEVWDRVDANYEETTRLTFDFECLASCTETGGLGDGYYCGRWAGCPVTFKYFAHVPSEVLVTFKTVRYPGTTYDDFGMGIAEGETVTKTIQIPQGVSYGDTVNFPQWWSDTYARFSRVRTSVGERGFHVRDAFLCADIRQSLEFYDPIEGD